MATTNPAKPERSYPEFPLFPHAAGVWAKKIKGRLHYFGPWGDPDAALAEYRREVDGLQAGSTPRAGVEDRLTLREAANHYLSCQSIKLQSGQLSPRSFAVCQKSAKC